MATTTQPHQTAQQQTTATSEALSQTKNFLLGGIATSTAVVFTNPFDVVKSRFQVQGELTKTTKANTHYTGLVDAFVKIGKNEGFGLNGLQKGLGPAVAYQFVMNGARLGSYSVLNSLTTNAEDNHAMKFAKKLFCGATAGVMGASLGSPLFLVKTRMQVQSNAISSVGEQYMYKNMFSALSEIYKSGGFRALYTGVSAAAVRVAMGSSVQLSTYDTTKQIVMNWSGLSANDLPVHVFSSFISGMFVVCVMHPFDVISTRLYMQRHGDQQKYTGILDCLIKTLKTEGYRGVYKGK